MSGFSVGWLRLRESADTRARNASIRQAVADHFAGRHEVSVIDLGCGTGSNLRATAEVLPLQQHWILVDHDATLLAEAYRALSAWAGASESEDGRLVLRKDDRRIAVSVLQCDLIRELDVALGRPADLVTAAALFDLVSASWIERLVERLAKQRLPLYAALTYNGAEHWIPADPRDARMLAAFCEHQKTDKGFGPSAGPDAGRVLERALAAARYEVRTGDSNWRLASGDSRLIGDIAKGIASAVLDTRAVPENEVAEWLDARCKSSTCVIGHTDLFAVPKD